MRTTALPSLITISSGSPVDGILVEQPVALVDGGGVLHCKFLAVFAQVVVTRPQAIDDT